MSIVTIEHWCYIEFFCNQDKSYFNTDKIQYLCYLNLILAKCPPKEVPSPGPSASASSCWALSSYATGSNTFPTFNIS